MESPKQRINSIYDHLSKVEKKIADYVLENYSDIMTMTLANLSSEIEVAESSIIRFTNLLSYKGFTEFKLAIASSKNSSTDFLDDIVAEKNSLEYTLKKYFQVNIENIESNFQSVDYALLELVAKLLSSKQRVFIVAQANHTGNVAEDFFNQLRAVLPNVRLARTINEITKDSQIMKQDDLVFAISYTGTTDGPILMAENAKEVNATVVVLTSSRKSPLYNLADHNVVAVPTSHQLGIKYPASLIIFRLITESIYFYIKKQKESSLTE